MASLAGLIAFLALFTHVFSMSILPKSTRTNGLHSPMSLHDTKPLLSWISSSTLRGDNQTAYQIQVSSSSNLDNADLWDSGKVSAPNNTVFYSGKALSSRSQAFWHVRVWDLHDAVSDWSSVDTFELGLLKPDDWKAKWIANQQYVSGVNSLPTFAKPWNVSCTSGLTKARLYIMGVGIYYVEINGQTITKEVLPPGDATWSQTMWYAAIDITDKLQENNVIGVELGQGMYDAEKPLGNPRRYYKWNAPAKQLKLLAQLEYFCKESPGEMVQVVSDQTWLTTVTGPYIEASWYGGEEYDARKKLTDYSKPSGNRSGWKNANISTSPGGQLRGAMREPMVVVDSFPAQTVTKTTAGWVFNFGVNFAGWYELTMDGTGHAGERIVFWPAENITRSGVITQASTGDPIYDGYTLAGKSGESYRQKFIYHGQQYVQVNLTWTPKASDMTAHVIRTNNDFVGDLKTSKGLFNSIHRNINRAIQSNMMSILTDCPHREKLGWLEENHLVFQPLTQSYDFMAYGNTEMRTMADSQSLTAAYGLPGLVPSTSPEEVRFAGAFSDDPNWGGSIILVPLGLYEFYGAPVLPLLETYYPNMQYYLKFLQDFHAKGSYLLSYGLGDWVTFDSCTPVGITASFAYARIVDGIGKIAGALGKTSDAAMYAELHGNILAAFHQKYFDLKTKASYSCGSQASNAIALDMGAVPSEYRSAVAKTLAQSLQANGNHLTVGEISLPSLFRSLASTGYQNVLFDMMSLTTNASYGYQVVQGATSLWEKWDGVSAGGGLNHFMLGYADWWLWSLCGMAQAPGSVGWERVMFQPLVLGDLVSAMGEYRSVKGTVSASWEIANGNLWYNVTVPLGSTGIVYMNGSNVAESGKALRTGQDGILSVGGSASLAIVEVGSGSYSFHSEF